MKKYSDIFREWHKKSELVSNGEVELAQDFCTYLDSHFDTELKELSEAIDESLEPKADRIHNMASCMLSILDSIKLYDKGSLELGDETLSEIMFRKMGAYNIDLNKELGFDHLKPVKKSKKKSKEELILKVVNDGRKSLQKTQKDHEKMIKKYQKKGFGNMHQNFIEDYKSGLNYTLGYTFGHLILLDQVNDLMSMTPGQIRNLIKKNKEIDKQNKKYMKEMFDKLKK